MVAGQTDISEGLKSSRVTPTPAATLGGARAVKDAGNLGVADVGSLLVQRRGDGGGADEGRVNRLQRLLAYPSQQVPLPQMQDV
jgi:hypothetical protein